MSESMEWEDDTEVDKYMLELAIEASIKEYSLHCNNINSNKNRSDKKDDWAVAGPSGFQTSKINSNEESEEYVVNGFDVEAGKTWIYPLNYAQRDYQFNIVKKCLFNNCLVCLPTGLGKTFIAAVLMYNYYRWYPTGKIVFMAPTKPLVAQQIQACFNVMAIPQEHMIEMTGSMNPNDRKSAWKAKRVFFLTPQVMTNDLSRGICMSKDVKCLVIDEAHRALGNHAYVVVVRELSNYTKHFRVLALSATPGSDDAAVQQVISNLHISAVETRTDESIDIQPYVHERSVEKVVVPLSNDIVAVKLVFMEVISLNVRRLSDQGVLWSRNPETLSKYALLKERDRFRQNPPDRLNRASYGFVESQFALCTSLYHCLELLQMHGLRSFYNFIQGIMDGQKSQPYARRELANNSTFMTMFDQLKSKFDPVLVQPDNVVIGHPKMEKLLEIVLEHFNRSKNAEESEGEEGGVSTRVMIFAEYRDTVNEITSTLEKHQPLIKAMSFVGRATVSAANKGLTQKLQQQIVSQFRNGHYNTLVSTCVGEEGLDIGDVDLIICYDAHKSPVRLVQRMGRTGRKRNGRIVMLVTKGKEERIYNQGQLNKKKINQAIANCKREYQMHQATSPMIPPGLNPTCQKMLLSAGDFQVKVGKRAVKVDGEENANAKRLKKNESAYLSADDLQTWSRQFKVELSDVYRMPITNKMLSLQSECDDVDVVNVENKSLSLCNWLPWQTTLQISHLVSHTSKTNLLVKTIRSLECKAALPANQEKAKEDKCNFKPEQKKFISDFFLTLPKSPNIVEKFNEKSDTFIDFSSSIKAEITDFFRFPKSMLTPSKASDRELTNEQVKTLGEWVKSLIVNENDKENVELVLDSCSDDELFMNIDLLSVKRLPEATLKTETMFGMTQLLELVAEDTPLSFAQKSRTNSKNTTPNFDLFVEDDSDCELTAFTPPPPPANVYISSLSPIGRNESGIASCPVHSTPKMTSMNDTKTPSVDGDDEDVVCLNKKKSLKWESVKKSKKKMSTVAKHFIESQAEVIDLEESSDEDEKGLHNAYINDSFVDDEASISVDETQMGMYLRSVKYPVRSSRVFASEAVANVSRNIFSQEPTSEESNYQMDSFCVDEKEETEEITSRKINEVRKWRRIKSVKNNDSSDYRGNSSSSSKSISPQSIAQIQQPNNSVKSDGLNVFVSSREVSRASVIISNLRNKHRANINVRSFTSCDYILSNRVGVVLKTVSDVGNVQSRQSLIARMKQVSAVHEKSYLLIEEDRVRSSEHSRLMLHTVYFDSLLAQISQSSVRILFSQSQEETANVLFTVTECEAKRGFGFQGVIEQSTGSFSVLSSLPDIGLCVALNFCNHFKSVKQFIQSSCEEKMRVGQISRAKAELVEKFLHHRVSNVV